ncbi:MAG: STAS domain-containing protein [Oscillospiraceae bacterium]|nr:STAS domain-containing protein [Oscillospiraceae bacterium]
MLNFKQSQQDGKAAFALEGRLDTATAPDLEQAIKAALDNVSELTLDLQKLDYISSAGLRVLLAAQKAMNSKQGKMELTHVGEAIMEIFEVTGFSDILTIV